LIPADGFYEWKRNGKSKQPYYFQLTDEAQFAFAGIWDLWQKNDVSITSCSIIMTAPNELLATIHDSHARDTAGPSPGGVASRGYPADGTAKVGS
jgi:putative SOS response-associated peptidase YedK